MMKIWAIWLLAFLNALSGCALLSPTDPYGPFEVHEGGPMRTVEGATSKSLGALSLKEAIATALSLNPDIMASRYDIEAASARKSTAFGAFFPRFDARGGYTRYLQGQRLVSATYQGEPGFFSRDIWSADAVLSMPLFAGGRLINGWRASQLLEKASREQMAQNEQELIFNVSSVYFQILAQRHVIEALGFSRKALQEHLKKVNELLLAQKAAPVDKMRTEVRLADIEQRLARERNVLAIESRILSNLMGVSDISLEPRILQDVLSTNTFQSLPALEKSLEIAFQNRRDYEATRARLEAQAKKVDQARASHAPSLNLHGAYGGRWGGTATDEPLGSDHYENVGQIGLSLTFPLFAGGQIYYKVQEEKAHLRKLREELGKLKLQIQLDVETAILNLASAQERVRAMQKSIEQARESLRIERQKYDFAKGSITDVLDAQSALLDSEMNYYRALADYSTAQSQYTLATGENK